MFTHTRMCLLIQHYQEVEEEPEPEWMEFGPTDRFDIIELKGFDKEELEREGMKIAVLVCTSKSTIWNVQYYWTEVYWLAKPL